MLNKDDFSKKLRFLLNKYEVSASYFADSIGVPRSSISHLLSGRNNPSLDFILKLLHKYPEVNFDWLVRGEGSFDEINIIENKIDKTPTLFNQEQIEKPRMQSSETLVKKHTSKDEIEKILVLYKDGSFKEYNR